LLWDRCGLKIAPAAEAAPPRRGFAALPFPLRSSRLEPPEAFPIIGDGSAMKLQLCFDQADPAPGAQMMAAFSGANLETYLDLFYRTVVTVS